MILARGQTYYFIDSIVGGCSAGRKLSVRISACMQLITGGFWWILARAIKILSQLIGGF